MVMATAVGTQPISTLLPFLVGANILYGLYWFHFVEPSIGSTSLFFGVYMAVAVSGPAALIFRAANWSLKGFITPLYC